MSQQTLTFGCCEIAIPAELLVTGQSDKDKQKITVGRAAVCDIRVDHRLVSAVHCEISRSADGSIVLKDMSVNGTWVNEMALDKGSEVELSTGDCVSVVKHKKTEINLVVSFMRECLDETVLVQDESDNESPPQKRLKTDEKVSDEEVVSTDDKKDVVEAAVEVKKSKSNELGDILNCPICFDLIHDCVSIQHCLHNFCNGCLGGWVKQSNNCPQCRIVIEAISRNHTLNSVIEAYIGHHPETKRSDSEVEKLSTTAILQAGSNQIVLQQSQNSSQSSQPSTSNGSFPTAAVQPILGFQMGNPSLVGPFNPRSQHFMNFGTCRRCPENISLKTAVPDKDALVPQCPPGQMHQLCNCCYQLFPLIQQAAASANTFISKCDLCNQAYCGMMMNCAKPGCEACLAPFKDMNFTDSCMTQIIEKNVYESTILQQFLEAQQKTWRNLLTECLDRLESGEFQQPDAAHPVNSTTIVCYRCGIKIFRALAYQYRKGIPRDQLPAEVRSRPDCYWGRNCNTQTHKLDHARRYNHICDQTRDV